MSQRASQDPDDVRVLFVEDDASVAQMYRLKLELDGLSVLEQLRADPATAGIPVVILSNWNEKELVERGISLGALDHLIKSQTTPARLSSRLLDWLKG